MTNAQEKAIERIKHAVLVNDSFGDGYEYKKFQITELDFAVEVITEVGRIGDEGTIAALCCRSKRQIFIGPKGGLTLTNPARYVTKNGTLQKKALSWVKGRKALTHLTI